MSSPMQSLGDSPTSLPTPGTERECSSLLAANAAAGNVNNNNSTSQQQQQQQSQHQQQNTYCQRRTKSAGKHRHTPYDRSPSGGSMCSTSSDDSCNEEDGDPDSQGGKPEKHVRKRTAANERERKRMHTVNSAFDQLRELVPTYPSSRKLSKIDTLKLACTYIQDLRTLLVQSHIMPHSEDVVYHPDGYPTTSPSPIYGQHQTGVHVKSEAAQFAASQDYPAAACPPAACTYPPFRVQQSYISVSSSSSSS